MIACCHFHISLSFPNDIIITICNSVIFIIFNTARTLLTQKSQKDIAFNIFIKNVDKEFWNYEGQSIGWGLMRDESPHQITFLTYEEVKIDKFQKPRKRTN